MQYCSSFSGSQNISNLALFSGNVMGEDILSGLLTGCGEKIEIVLDFEDKCGKKR